VRAGATILVQDRDLCIAEIRQLEAAGENPVLQAWAAGGEVSLPKGKRRKLGPSPVRLKAGLVQEILDAERAE